MKARILLNKKRTGISWAVAKGEIDSAWYQEVSDLDIQNPDLDMILWMYSNRVLKGRVTGRGIRPMQTGDVVILGEGLDAHAWFCDHFDWKDVTGAFCGEIYSALEDKLKTEIEDRRVVVTL